MTLDEFPKRILAFECPRGERCRLQPPLDELAERLRKEMVFGRDFSRGPACLFGLPIGMATGYRGHPDRN